MKNIDFGRAVTAGWASTLVMTIAMATAPRMGMPKMDIAAMLGSLFAGRTPAPGSFPWIAGLALHLLIGSVALSVIYAWTQDYLPTSIPLAKGLAYGALVWLVAQIMVMPMMGAGFFSSRVPNGHLLALGSLAGHLIYGAVLGSAYGPHRSAKRVSNIITLGL